MLNSESGITGPIKAVIPPQSYHMGLDVHSGPGAQDRYGTPISSIMDRASESAQNAFQLAGGGSAGIADGRLVIMNTLRDFDDNMVRNNGGFRAMMFQEISRAAETTLRP